MEEEAKRDTPHTSPILHRTLTSLLSDRIRLSLITLFLALPLSLAVLLLDRPPAGPASLLIDGAARRLLLLPPLALLLAAAVLRTVSPARTHHHVPLAATLLCAHLLLLSSRAAAVAAVSLLGLLVRPAAARLALLVVVSAAYVAALAGAGAAWLAACAAAAAEGAGVLAAWRRGRELLRGRAAGAAAAFLGLWLAVGAVETAYDAAAAWACRGVLAVLLATVLVLATLTTIVAYNVCSEEEERRYFSGEYVVVDGQKLLALQEPPDP